MRTEMPEEEFIITGINLERDQVVVGFSVTDTKSRMSNLLYRAERKWAKQYGENIPLPKNYRAEIISQGIPPMIISLSIKKWYGKGFQLGDTVKINVPETTDDIILVKRANNFDV